jgi:quinol monooxygenase YgiN
VPTPYINAVELDIVPAEYEKFKAAILDNAAASVKEPGCRQFDVLFEDSDPHHVFFYEVYDDETALEAHRATARFKKRVFVESSGLFFGLMLEKTVHCLGILHYGCA